MNDMPDSPDPQPFLLSSELHDLVKDARKNGIEDADFIRRVRAFLDGLETG